jgi:CheY-like chemotaxis protein
MDESWKTILSSFRSEKGKDSVASPADARVYRTTRPKRVLIVEDNLEAVRSSALLIADMGHVVEYAINGYVAIDVARHFRPDFVLLDLGLPGLDGFDVCSRLKRDPNLRHTRFIAITGYAQDEYRVRSMAVGCELHLVKPVSPRLLEELLG